MRSPDGGDNLFLSSIVALNPDTGAYVWHYQTTPGDTWDYTATQHIVLTDLVIDGENRSVLMQAPKNGFFYVLDRATGELISAQKYAPVSWASHVDMVTGRPVETSNADHSEESKMTAPFALGAHNWQPMAFNKGFGLVYIPAMEAMMPYSTARNFVARKGGHWNLAQDGAAMKGGSMGDVPNGLAKAMVKKMLRGNLIAWDPVTQQERWRVKHPTVWNGGILTTKSGLVFQGTGDQRFVAYNAGTGEKLWEAPTGTGIVAPPVTYEIKGEQYIAVMAGWGGAGGLTMPNIVQSDGTSRMLVYKLGANAPHPPKTTGFHMGEAPPASSASSASVANGENLYNENCARCHGPNIGRGGIIPDLRYMNAGTHALFNDIVRGGIFYSIGMVSFSDVLSEEETRDIHNYLIHMANKTWDDQNASGWWHEFVLWVFELLSGIVVWFMTL